MVWLLLLLLGDNTERVLVRICTDEPWEPCLIFFPLQLLLLHLFFCPKRERERYCEKGPIYTESIESKRERKKSRRSTRRQVKMGQHPPPLHTYKQLQCGGLFSVVLASYGREKNPKGSITDMAWERKKPTNNKTVRGETHI